MTAETSAQAMKDHCFALSAGLLLVMLSAGFTYNSYGPTSLNHCADVLQQQLSRSEQRLHYPGAGVSQTADDKAWAQCEPIIKEVAALKLSR